MKIREHDALIVVDVQHDFLPGGALGVPTGDQIIPGITSIAPMFNHVVLTRDWHPPNHCSFEKNGGPWPVHCVDSSHGAEFAIDIRHDCVVSKGMNASEEAYSGFKGVIAGEGSVLSLWLYERFINRVFVCGLALDYCVRATALDAATSPGIEDVFVIFDLTRGVTKDGIKKATSDFWLSGIKCAFSPYLKR